MTKSTWSLPYSSYGDVVIQQAVKHDRPRAAFGVATTGSSQIVDLLKPVE